MIQFYERQKHRILYKHQSHFILDENDNLLVDYIGRVEDFEKSIKYIFEKLKLPEPKSIPHKNIGPKFNIDTEIISNYVKNIYSKDYKFQSDIIV